MTVGQSLPLSMLRSRLDDASGPSRWPVDADGVLGRMLELAAGSAYTIDLALDRAVSLHARAMLYPHDWRDGSGAVRVAVTATDAGVVQRLLWEATLRAGDRGRPRGSALQCELPAGTRSITLEVQPSRRRPAGAVSRAIWVDPRLLGTGLDTTAAPAAQRTLDPATPAGAGDGGGPLVSVLVPVHDPPVAMLDEMVASVRAQTFTDWELCLVDDGSRHPEVVVALQRHDTSDPRIRLRRHPVGGGISAATNTALDLAVGRYIALLDHDDTLAPDALQRVATAIAADPSLDMLYSDEDIVDDGRQVWVHLKPAWSPDTLRTNGYTCHLGVYRRTLVGEIGGFRSEFDGSQDIDMILRLTERTDRIAHVPGILYHWRAHAASTAGGDAKPYAYVAARDAYAAHLQRTGVAGRVGYGPPGLYRLTTTADPATVVVIAAAIQGANGLAAAARSWREQPHPAWRAVLSVAEDEREAVADELKRAGIDPEQVQLLAAGAGPSGLAAAAAGAAQEDAEQVLLLRSPAIGLTHDWLGRLAGYAGQSGIAAAGPIVLAPDGRVQDGGVALPEGIPLYLLHGRRTSMDDFFGFGTSAHNVSALSGALLTPAATFRELGGLDPGLRELALIDYCLRAGEAGGRIVTVPDVRLRRSGIDPAVNDLSAMRALRTRWSRHHTGDPYYNPGYRADRGDFSRVGCAT